MTAKTNIKASAPDEFWIYVHEDVKTESISDQCGIFEELTDALDSAHECADDGPGVVYHCVRIRRVSK